MGIISVETPDGIKQVEIKGDVPSEEEQTLIQQTFFQDTPQVSAGLPDPATTSFDQLREYYQGQDSDSQLSDFTPTVEGQVTVAKDRFEFGKADSPQEKEEFLARTYGPNSFGKDNQGRYYLNLDNISPEIKAEKGISSESGTMWFNKPGGGFLGLFDMPDVSEFLGQYRGELIGGTVAAVATGGAGLIAASAAIGLGAGLGKGVDELIEYEEGTQRQTPDEIYGDMASATLWNSFGNLIVGGVLKGLGRLIKGPGNPDAQVIDDLIQQGAPESQAKAIATQMQRTQTRDAIEKGARPTISDVTGKAVLSRMQAIYEGILPNKTAARANRKYVEDLINQYKNGQLSDDALGRALDDNAKEISRVVSNAMKNPDEAVRLANQHLRDVIGQEMDLLKKLYTTGDETAVAFQNEMTRMVRLWQNNNKELYDNASQLMGDAKLFKFEGLRKTVENQLKAPLAAEQGLANNPVYQYILGKTDDYTLGELQALRTTINNSRSGSLVGDVTDFQLKGLSNKLDEMFSSAELEIQKNIAKLRSGTMSYKELNITPPEGRNAGQIIPRDEALKLSNKYAEGFDKFIEAQKHYKDGAEIFKSGAMSMLNKNIKEGFFADLNSVVESVVQNNKPELLRNYLKSVTPDKTVTGAMQSIPETQWSAMATAARAGNINEVNRLLNKAFPSLREGVDVDKTIAKIGLAFKPPPFISSLPDNSPYRQRILNDLAETFELHAEDALAAASGKIHKDVSRQMLAKTWIQSATKQAEDLGVFDPAAFRRSFDALGKEVQTELFGKAEANRLNSVLKDFALVAPDTVKGGFRFASTAPESITNSNMRNIVQNLQSDVAEAQSQSTSALFKAVKSGRITDSDTLVQAAVKDPKLLDDLIQKVPGNVVDEPYGLRDAFMSRIIRESFPKGITEEAIISGAWRDGMASSINNLNQRGSLNRVLGRDTVRDLVKMSKLPVGDTALKGKAGLVSSAYAAGIGFAVLTNPLIAIPSVAGIYLAGRILRNPTFLNLMTRPNIRASELRQGIKSLSDDIMSKAKADGVDITRKQAIDSAKKQLGNLNYMRIRLEELVANEARIMGATKSSEATDAESRQGMVDFVSEIGDSVQPVVQDIQQQLPDASQATSALRQIELNKLLGVTPTQ